MVRNFKERVKSLGCDPSQPMGIYSNNDLKFDDRELPIKCKEEGKTILLNFRTLRNWIGSYNKNCGEGDSVKGKAISGKNFPHRIWKQMRNVRKMVFIGIGCI